MKKILNIPVGLITLALALAVTSCDEKEILQEIPLDFASPENSFVTEGDFNSAIYALYDLTRGTLSDGEHRPMDYHYGTDLGYNGAQQLNQRFGSYPATLTPNSVEARFHWQQYYKIISSANIILNRLTKSKLTANQKTLVEARAKLFRGLAYRNLAHLYGGVPIELEEVGSPKTDYTRTTREATYQQAAKDLEFAAANLPGITRVRDGEINNLAAYHLLAETYLSLKRYSDAVKAAFADAGYPVLGDPRYKTKQAMHSRWIRKRIALHAKSLGFEHPVTGEELRFESEPPAEFARLQAELSIL